MQFVQEIEDLCTSYEDVSNQFHKCDVNEKMKIVMLYSRLFSSLIRQLETSTNQPKSSEECQRLMALWQSVKSFELDDDDQILASKFKFISDWLLTEACNLGTVKTTDTTTLDNSKLAPVMEFLTMMINNKVVTADNVCQILNLDYKEDSAMGKLIRDNFPTVVETLKNYLNK